LRRGRRRVQTTTGSGGIIRSKAAATVLFAASAVIAVVAIDTVEAGTFGTAGGPSARGRPIPVGESATTVPPTVGALFGEDGAHFCTASVVGTAEKAILMTAAHCVYDDGPRTNVTFIPGYHDGQRPYGTWKIADILVDAAWSADAEPAADVAFMTVAESGLAAAVGANTLGVDAETTEPVQVVGYPTDREQPLACLTDSHPETPDRLRFDCTNFADGTSGSPWLAARRPGNGPGEVIGMIGGYELGGSSSDTSYSPRLGDAVRALYNRAMGNVPAGVTGLE
jgi:V8-like Glu-specific endopeptidase